MHLRLSPTRCDCPTLDTTVIDRFAADQHPPIRTRGLLRALVRFAGARPGRAIDRQMLRDFLGRSPHAPGTISREITDLRWFYRWWQRTGAITTSPAHELTRPKCRRQIPQILRVQDVSAIVGAVSARSAAGARDRAILELLFGAAMTARELVALELEDVDLEVKRRGLGTLAIAGTRARELPLGRGARSALRGYLARRHELGAVPASRGRPLFVNAGARMTADLVRKIVRRYGLVGASRDDVTPTLIRSSFIVHLLDGGADVSVVRILLGHRSVRSASRFLPFAIDHLVRVYDAAHPLARRAGARHASPGLHPVPLDDARKLFLS